MSQRLPVPTRPCESCPYRKDVPPGIWDATEYEKLRGYDDNTNFGTFLCHNAPDAVCKGWLCVHAESVAVRLAIATGAVPGTARYELPLVPLYASGNEAADAGQRGIKRPTAAAKRLMRKILRKRARRIDR